MKGKISKNIIYVVIIWSFFLLERVVFTVGGGNFRVYFILSLLVLLKFIPSLKRCTVSNIFLLSIMYIFAMFASSLCSDNILGALANTMSSILYIITAYVIVLILVSRKISVLSMQDVIYKIFLFLMIFGLFQLILYSTTGILFYDAGMLYSGQISGFSVEPNGHGKIVGAAIVFSIPILVRNSDSKTVKKYGLLLAMALITLFVSMTRNAFYCVIATVMVLVIFYFPEKYERKRLILLIVVIGIVASILMLAESRGIIVLQTRSMEKLDNLFMFSEEEIMNDESGNFRWPLIVASLESWVQSAKSFWIGHGPGQAYATVKSVYTKLAGNGIIVSLAGVGILGTMLYGLMLFLPIYKSVKASKLIAKKTNDFQLMLFAEQCFSLAVYIFIMDFVATSFYYAIMWIVVALGMFWELKIKSINRGDDQDGMII